MASGTRAGTKAVAAAATSVYGERKEVNFDRHRHGGRACGENDECAC